MDTTQVLFETLVGRSERPLTPAEQAHADELVAIVTGALPKAFGITYFEVSSRLEVKAVPTAANYRSSRRIYEARMYAEPMSIRVNSRSYESERHAVEIIAQQIRAYFAAEKGVE